jgi:hypothetical protein
MSALREELLQCGLLVREVLAPPQTLSRVVQSEFRFRLRVPQSALPQHLAEAFRLTDVLVVLDTRTLRVDGVDRIATYKYEALESARRFAFR